MQGRVAQGFLVVRVRPQQEEALAQSGVRLGDGAAAGGIARDDLLEGRARLAPQAAGAGR